jgi:hypothetical protein
MDVGPRMSITVRAIVIACVIFSGALIGSALQLLLPSQHLADAKGAIGMIQGLVTLLLALVLGLLVWTSYGVYAQQVSEAHTLGSQILQLVLALDRYGPGAAGGRELVRKELEDTRERFWGGGEGGAATISYGWSRAELKSLDSFFAVLKPATDDQRAALDTARSLSASMVETHYLMSRQLRNPLPPALIDCVVLWAAFLFCCVGMAATFNALALIVELLGAVAVASALFLILEFSQPYSGVFRISCKGIDQVIEALTAESGAA